jgi:hypothetical protein
MKVAMLLVLRIGRLYPQEKNIYIHIPNKYIWLHEIEVCVIQVTVLYNANSMAIRQWAWLTRSLTDTKFRNAAGFLSIACILLKYRSVIDTQVSKQKRLTRLKGFIIIVTSCAISNDKAALYLLVHKLLLSVHENRFDLGSCGVGRKQFDLYDQQPINSN